MVVSVGLLLLLLLLEFDEKAEVPVSTSPALGPEAYRYSHARTSTVSAIFPALIYLFLGVCVCGHCVA